MIRRFLFASFVLACALPAAAASDDWKSVAAGVEYREFAGEHTDIHVARIRLTNDAIQVTSTPEPYRGTTVSDFALKTKAIVAINGDYFDSKFNPRGLMINPCDQWAGAKENPMHESIVAVGSGHASIQPQSAFDATAEPVASAVAGWPVLIKSCTPLTAKELPGSDIFTRSPQPRTAVGISKDGATMYFVVADGRRTGIPGLTLADLATFMAEELGVCSAVNLDGGGSTTMWVGDKVVNRPADGVERKVGDHLAVILRSDAVCPPPYVQLTASTETTTTRVTTTTVTTTTTIAPSAAVTSPTPATTSMTPPRN